MSVVVLGVFSDRINAENAISELEANDYNPKDMSILMKDSREAKDISKSTGADVADGAVSGASTGALVGGVAGFLAGTVMPALGGFLIGGPIGAALGLTGAAATTVSGVATGVVAGGLIGALTGTFGLSEDEARSYETRINEGGILIAVPAKNGEEAEVKTIMKDFDADNIRLVDSESTARSAHRSSSSHHDDREAYRHMGAKGGRAIEQEDEEIL